MITDTDFDIKNRSAFVGMARKDINRYSVARLFRSIERGREPEGIEAEMHQELSRSKLGTASVEGVGIPWDVLAPTRTRDLNVDTFGQGGAFVQTDVEPSVIPVLRNKTTAIRLGATVWDGLTGNVALPRETAPATFSAQTETGVTVPSTQTLDQILMSPKRATASVQYSRQLVLQSSVAVENWLRADLAAQVGIKLDYFILNGQGAASEPTGILNTTGIGSLLFGGPASWQTLLNFEAALATANADVPDGKFGWVVSPSTRNRWKQIAKTGTGVSTTVPIFLWETLGPNDATNDGNVNGYRAATTNQVFNNQAFFGNWAEVILGMFGRGVDVIVNPFSLDVNAEMRITVHTYADVCVRHPVSFCVSADSGAQ